MTVFKKSLFTLGITALGFSAVLGVFSMVFMNYLYYEINTTALGNTAKTLLNAIGEDKIAQIFTDNAGSDTLLSDLELPVKSSGGYRLTLIAPSGYVLWDSHAADRFVNHLDREEVAVALEGKEASVHRNSVSTGEELIYYALPVFDPARLPQGSRVIGVFRVSVSVPTFGVRISPVIVPFLVYLCLLTILALWAIFAFSRSLADSVGRLVTIAQNSAPLLSGTQAEDLIAPEFRSLENAMRAMSQELNLRFEQAKEESARLEAILNGMSEAVFAMDCALKLHLVNPRARKIFNIGDRDIISSSLLEATHSAELEDIAKKALNTDTPLEMELTIRTGAEQHFRVFATQLVVTHQSDITAGRERGGVVIVLQDVTQLVKLERVRKDFVANVSHELRTPIQLIKGFSETLHGELAGDENNKQILHFIEIIQKNAGIMENLTNDLLILADLENNGVNSYQRNTRDMEEENVAFLIEEAVSSVEPQAKRKNININTDCPDNLSAGLYGSYIIQALINLIDNAVKYSPPDSTVWVSAGVREVSEKCQSGVRELVIEVRDKGKGIPPEHMERIFERFYRVDRARANASAHKSGREGTGLGLSIVRHIALLHNGKAEAESVPGEGSVFRLRLPQFPSD